MERFFRFFGRRKDKETRINISLTPEASRHLKSLMCRPNPNLAEFAFLGLGHGSLVDQILVVDEGELKNKRGLSRRGEGFVSSVSFEEHMQLSLKLAATGRYQDLIILGHLHPSGIKKVEGKYYVIGKDDGLLEPSMGSPSEGGPASNGDLGFFRELLEEKPEHNVIYAGIAAVTKSGPKLRLYKASEMVKIKRYNDIDKVPQITIDL